MTYLVHQSLSFLFADDTTIYLQSISIDRLIKVINKELKDVKAWLESNKLSLNIEKTTFQFFTLPKGKSNWISLGKNKSEELSM